VLSELERGADPAFFELVRRHVMEGMFGDPAYGGNRDRAGWELLGYAGPRLVWTEAEQRLRAR
jgi:gluconate 2-dehydrogenase gamma chain